MATVLTTNGKGLVTGFIKAGGATEPLNVGWGTGAGTAAVGDTTLFTEVATDGTTTSGARTVGTSSQVTTGVANDTYQVVATRAATGAAAITNAGLFTNVTIASGSMFIKGDFSVINLANGDSITFTFKCQFT